MKSYEVHADALEGPDATDSMQGFARRGGEEARAPSEEGSERAVDGVRCNERNSSLIIGGARRGVAAPASQEARNGRLANLWDSAASAFMPTSSIP